MDSGFYIYQKVHTLAGVALHLADHLDIAARAYHEIFGDNGSCSGSFDEKNRPCFDEKTEKEIAARIAEVLRDARSPSRGSAVVTLRFAAQTSQIIPNQQIIPNRQATQTCTDALQPTRKIAVDVEFGRTLLDTGYAVSSLRPQAVTYEYSIPFPAAPTGFQLSAQVLFDTLALSHHGATRSIRREGDKLLMCGAAPLFGIRGNTLFTAPIADGVPDSVERRRTMEAASKVGLHTIERAILRYELTQFDELFFADAAGITSLASCDGARFMSLTVNRLITHNPNLP
ncbi:MAG: hypothetical protein LBV18_01210 [Alistipes sp.]|jgi:hypothetical protein|nr:hypothetical protein [Alistipes sp.]